MSSVGGSKATKRKSPLRSVEGLYGSIATIAQARMDLTGLLNGAVEQGQAQQNIDRHIAERQITLLCEGPPAADLPSANVVVWEEHRGIADRSRIALRERCSSGRSTAGSPVGIRAGAYRCAMPGS
jgi:hypothetical protein